MRPAILFFAILYIAMIQALAQPAWQAGLDSKVRFYQTTDFGIVLAGTERRLYALDGRTGETLWRRETGKIDETTTFDASDFRNIVPRFTPEARKANQALVDLLGRIGKRKGATPAQIALAWLLAQRPWIVPIPGTTKLHRLEENLGAAQVELTAGDLSDIERAASEITVHGARYPENLEKMTGR